MTEKQKVALLRDLSARIPYEVKVEHPSLKMPYPLKSVSANEDIVIGNNLIGTYVIYPSICKPYLRPMSSMTEEEFEEYNKFVLEEKDERIKFCESMNFYGKYHFDYRGLIDMGIAIAVTEENNPYD